ncbi:10880_t:CDS:2, partial [Ambispora gerdemannii]
PRRRFSSSVNNAKRRAACLGRGGTSRVRLKMLGEKGVGHIQVMCPGFAADCLETLEEIAEQNREVFLGAGGKKYEYIPALNATPEHIEMMANLVAAYR